MPELSPQDWIVLGSRLERQRLTPIIGDRVFSQCLPDVAELVEAWKDSESVKYPYLQRPSIGRLARYVSSKTREPGVAYLHFVKEHLAHHFAGAKKIPRSRFLQASVTEIAGDLGCLASHDEPGDALHSLARLPLPIYITTSYFTVLEAELRKVGKAPESAICYWRKDLKPGISVSDGDGGRLLDTLRKKFNKEEARNLAYALFGSAYEDLPDEGFGSLHRELIRMAQREDSLEDLVLLAREQKPAREWDSLMEAMGMSDEESVSRVPSVFLEEPEYRPSAERPLVFHLYGIDTHPSSLVLTEDDYIDFLIFTSREKDALPAPVIRALSDSSIVMLGYELHEWEFIILFRGLISSRRRQRSKVNICLQQPPSEEDVTIASDRQREVETYLERYLDKSDFSVYWGGPAGFLSRLHVEEV